MKMISVYILIGLIIGGVVGYKIKDTAPAASCKAEIVTETKDKIVTIIKSVAGKEVLRTITQDRIVKQEHNIIPLPKQYMFGLSKGYGTYEIVAGRRVVGDFWINVGLTADKQIKMGLIYEF